MAKEKVAVIFVPGIFASHLDDTVGGWTAWPVNKNKKMLAYLAETDPTIKHWMMAAAHRFKVGGSLDSPEESWKSVGMSFYEDFLKDCHRNTEDLPFEPVVWGAGYNFTRSNAVSANRIWEVIQQALEALPTPNNGDKKFLIVTHSMGALPTRFLLLMKTETRRKCLGVIHVVAPNGGSPEFIMRYFRGMVAKRISKSNITKIILGSKGWRVTTAASAIQGAYELFPFANPTMPGFDSTSGPPPSPKNPPDPYFLHELTDYVFSDRNPEKKDAKPEHYRNAVNSKNEIHRNIDKYNTSAMLFHKHLGRYVFHKPDGNRTAAVCLTGKKTVQEVGYKFGDNGELVDIKPVESNDGDGTVPLWSQKMFLDGDENFIYSKTLQALRKPYVEIPGGLDHSDPFKKKHRKPGADVYKEIYDYMTLFYWP